MRTVIVSPNEKSEGKKHDKSHIVNELHPLFIKFSALDLLQNIRNDLFN